MLAKAIVLVQGRRRYREVANDHEPQDGALSFKPLKRDGHRSPGVDQSLENVYQPAGGR
jgi:hypothetical protein